MTPKPFLTTFEIMMLSFIFVAFVMWIYANVKNNMRARMSAKEKKQYRDRWNVLRSTEPMDSSMSNRDNLTYKN